jgi:hypothetical protein
MISDANRASQQSRRCWFVASDEEDSGLAIRVNKTLLEWPVLPGTYRERDIALHLWVAAKPPGPSVLFVDHLRRQWLPCSAAGVPIGRHLPFGRLPLLILRHREN